MGFIQICKQKHIVKASIYENQSFLLQLRDDSDEIPYPNQWALFGGQVEKGESFWGALQRELFEELEWVPNVGSFLFSWGNPDSQVVIHFFSVPFVGFKAKLVLHEGQELAWFEKNELIKMKHQLPPSEKFFLNSEHFKNI